MENRSEILQGTLDLMVLQTLEVMGPLHGYGVARRIEQISEARLLVNQGTIYLCLVRLVQKKWIKAEWTVSENNQQVKSYRLTSAGKKQLATERSNWDLLSAAMAGILHPQEQE